MPLLKNLIKKPPFWNFQNNRQAAPDSEKKKTPFSSHCIHSPSLSKKSKELFNEPINDLYPKKRANCPCRSGKKYKKCCEEKEKEVFSTLEKGLTLIPGEKFFSLEDEADTQRLLSCVEDLNHHNFKAAIKNLLSLIKKYPNNNHISFFLALGYRLLFDIKAFQRILIFHQESYLPLQLLRWWHIFDYNFHYPSFPQKISPLSQMAPNRKEFCLTEFCLWGLMRLLEALNQGRYIEGEAHFISLIKTAEQLGSPNHWALDKAEIFLESAYFSRRLKLKSMAQ